MLIGMKQGVESNLKNTSSLSRLKKRYMLIGFSFLAPALIIYIVFAVYPFFSSMVLSFFKWNGFSPREYNGIGNYVKAFSDRTFIIAIKNSTYLGVLSAAISVTIGVIMAWLLLFVGRRWGATFRTILFSPSMLPAVITALIFAFVYEPELGILNSFLRWIGLESWQMAWLTNKSTAMNSILFVSIWKQIGLTMVLCFAGMQGINNSLIESACLDGASDWQIFTKIILRLILPFVQLSSIFALMGGLKIFDTVLALTNGGPANSTTVMPLWILRNSFTYNKFGYGAAMSMIFVFIVMIAMIIAKVLVKGTTYEQ